MLRRSFACLLLTASLLLPAQKPATSKGENQDLVLTVTLYIDPQSINEVIGADLGKDYIVAAVKVEPKAGKEVAVDRDDFVLRTDKDGEKVKPFAASQIAGRGALIVTRSGGGGMGIGNAGGYPGGYPPPVYPGSGPPPPIMRPGGISAGTVGEGDTREVSATVRHPARDKENPLEKILKDKALPEKPTREAVSGLLYFGMSKQKMKNLELLYGGRENRISLRFKN